MLKQLATLHGFLCGLTGVLHYNQEATKGKFLCNLDGLVQKVESGLWTGPWTGLNLGLGRTHSVDFALL